jgi:Fe-S-cluster-containing hydrogenase component 2
MMRVDLEKCTGCGGCLEACPVEAICMVEGKAAIDVDTCLSCDACVKVCPEGAISEVRLPVPVTMAVIQPVKMQTITPVLVSSSESRVAWARPVLSLVGREIVPRLVDTLIAALDRRLSDSSKDQVTLDSETVPQTNGGRRQVRRRCNRRGSKF